MVKKGKVIAGTAVAGAALGGSALIYYHGKKKIKAFKNRNKPIELYKNKPLKTIKFKPATAIRRFKLNPANDITDKNIRNIVKDWRKGKLAGDQMRQVVANPDIYKQLARDKYIQPMVDDHSHWNRMLADDHNDMEIHNINKTLKDIHEVFPTNSKPTPVEKINPVPIEKPIDIFEGFHSPNILNTVLEIHPEF